jgi:phosphoglycerate dehydrogenase-like enzyme
VTHLPQPPLTAGFDEEHAAFLDAVEQGTEPLNSLMALTPSLNLAELIEAGFSGPLPTPVVARLAPAPKSPAAGSLLLVNAAGLLAGLGAAAPRRPLVALDEVLHSPAARPDIVAALLGTGPQVLTAEALDKLPGLKVAGLAGLSFARHAPDLLLERGVALVNASEAYAESVAEFAFALAVLARRRAFASDRVMRRGGWGTALDPGGWRGSVLKAGRALRPTLARAGLERPLLETWRRTKPLHGVEGGPAHPARDLRGATAGLVGWGASARALAARLSAAGAQVQVFSDHASPQELRQTGVSPVGLGQALAADIVSLHRGLTPETRHALGAAELDRLRPGCILINVASAALIEPEALLARLKKGDVFACLDVFEDEPPPRGHPLRKLPNVFLTSHIAGGSRELQPAAVREVVDKIERHLGGAPSPTIARERLRTMT